MASYILYVSCPSSGRDSIRGALALVSGLVVQQLVAEAEQLVLEELVAEQLVVEEQLQLQLLLQQLGLLALVALLFLL